MGSAWDDWPEGTFHLVIIAIFMITYLAVMIG